MRTVEDDDGFFKGLVGSNFNDRVYCLVHGLWVENFPKDRSFSIIRALLGINLQHVSC